MKLGQNLKTISHEWKSKSRQVSPQKVMSMNTIQVKTGDKQQMRFITENTTPK